MTYSAALFAISIVLLFALITSVWLQKKTEEENRVSALKRVETYRVKWGLPAVAAGGPSQQADSKLNVDNCHEAAKEFQEEMGEITLSTIDSNPKIRKDLHEFFGSLIVVLKKRKAEKVPALKVVGPENTAAESPSDAQDLKGTAGIGVGDQQ